MMDKEYKGLMVAIAMVAVVILGYVFLTTRDTRSAPEKVGDAIHELPHGVDKATRELEDRTPGQKLGDAVKDNGDKLGEKIKNNTNP